jgi:hypothetical protein
MTSQSKKDEAQLEGWKRIGAYLHRSAFASRDLGRSAGAQIPVTEIPDLAPWA